MPGRLHIRVKAPFGEVVVEGDTAKEILAMLRDMPPEFLVEVGDLISSKLSPPLKTHLGGIVEFTTEGPVVTARGKFTHYEAIGLVLYASENRMSTAALIDRLLQSSGVRAMVPARLNEMTKRGLVFKPDLGRSEFRLTAQGEKWVEGEVVPKLKEDV